MKRVTKVPNKLQAKQRKETDDKVIAALKKHRVMSLEQLVAATRIIRSTLELAIARLRRGGVIRMLPDKRPVGKNHSMARVFELGVDEKAVVSHEPIEFKVHRHPQDIALFGEYRSAA